MSKEADRHAVFQTTRVRTSLKNDVCWIHKSKQEQEESRSKDSSLSPQLENTQFSSSDSDSSNQAKSEVIPTQEEEAQPEGSTVETTDDAKPQAPTEELIQKDEAHPEKTVANTTAENKEEYAAVYQSNVEQNGVAADVSVAEQIQNGEQQLVPSTEEGPVAVSPVEADEQTVANTTAEIKEEITDATVDRSKVEPNEATVSADAHVEGPAVETSVPAVELKPKEEPATKTEPANVTQLEHAEVQSIVHPAEEMVEAVAEVAVESSSDTSDGVNVILVKEVEPVAEVVTKPSSVMSDEVNVILVKEVEPVAEVVTKPSSGMSDGVNATPGKEAALQISVEPVPDLLAETASERPSPPATETAAEGNCEKGLPEQAVGESLEAVDEVDVESSPEIPAVTAGENAALQVSVAPYPDLVADTASKSPAQADVDTAVKPEESIVESAASAEPVLKTGAEEVVVQCEVQPVECAESERAADHVVELTIKDAVEPGTSSDAEAAVDEFSDRLIQLSEALDVELPPTEAAPEPLKDQNQSHTEETKLNQHSDDSNMAKEDPQSTQTQDETRRSNVCSFCENIIYGNVKIYLNEPVVTCHPDCLKCGVCAKALGDMLTPMFLHDQVVQCGGCFAEALKTRT